MVRFSEGGLSYLRSDEFPWAGAHPAQPSAQEVLAYPDVWIGYSTSPGFAWMEQAVCDLALTIAT